MKVKKTKKTETKTATAPAKAVRTSPDPKAAAKTPTATINRGKTTGMRVMAYQDKLLADNVKAKLTDMELLKALRAEFPNAKGKIFTGSDEERLSILRSVRALFNRGKHGDQQVAAPKGGVPEFDAKGAVVEARAKTRTAKSGDAPLAKTA